MYSHGKDAKATLYFEGTQVIVGGSLNRAHSTYQFAIDGKVAGTFNAGTASGKHQQVLFTSEKLENRVHELVITNVGETDTIQLDFADVVHKPIKVSGMTLDTDDFALEAGKQRELSYTLLPALADPVPVCMELQQRGCGHGRGRRRDGQGGRSEGDGYHHGVRRGQRCERFRRGDGLSEGPRFQRLRRRREAARSAGERVRGSMTTFADEWSDVAWLGDARASKIGVATRDHRVDGVTIEVGGTSPPRTATSSMPPTSRCGGCAR